MRIGVSGASGKTGYRIVEEALVKGYEVVPIFRKNSLIPKSLRTLDKRSTSLFDKHELDETLKGLDILIIATGARPSVDLISPARIDAFGVINQVESCRRVGIKRVILVSSLCAGKIFHPLNLFGLILFWKRIGEQKLESSGLDWTIIRPGGLSDKEENLDKEGIIYSGMDTQNEGSIPRRLVARCCIESIDTDKAVGKIIEITSNTEHLNKSLKSSL